jgi:hypothetical protein
MNWTEWAANFAFLGIPPLSCVWAWWLWSRGSGDTALLRWRRAATMIALIAATLSIAQGAFALIYWHRFPGGHLDPPEPTRIATLTGFAFAVSSFSLSVLATSWTRVALMLCCVALLGFYAGMFLAP